MVKYKVKYYFDKDFSVIRLLEETDKELATLAALPEGGDIIQFEGSDKVVYRFSMKDVRMISVAEYKTTKAVARPF